MNAAHLSRERLFHRTSRFCLNLMEDYDVTAEVCVEKKNAAKFKWVDGFLVP